MNMYIHMTMYMYMYMFVLCMFVVLMNVLDVQYNYTSCMYMYNVLCYDLHVYLTHSLIEYWKERGVCYMLLHPKDLC